MRITSPMAVGMLPLNGIFRLCRKLPRTISDDAHIVPSNKALTHLILSCMEVFCSGLLAKKVADFSLWAML